MWGYTVGVFLQGYLQCEKGESRRRREMGNLECGAVACPLKQRTRSMHNDSSSLSLFALELWQRLRGALSCSSFIPLLFLLFLLFSSFPFTIPCSFFTSILVQFLCTHFHARPRHFRMQSAIFHDERIETNHTVSAISSQYFVCESRMFWNGHAREWMGVISWSSCMPYPLVLLTYSPFLSGSWWQGFTSNSKRIGEIDIPWSNFGTGMPCGCDVRDWVFEFIFAVTNGRQRTIDGWEDRNQLSGLISQSLTHDVRPPTSFTHKDSPI